MTQPLLQIRNASKSYNGVPALINADLDLFPGEVHALMGENGAGKSTLIRLIAGVTPADRLSVQVRGSRVSLSVPSDAYAHGLRFIHQELNVVPALSVAENLFLGWDYETVGGVMVNWGRLYARARDVLGQLDIHHISPRRTMARLSPGDQMLVKIASAFVDQDESDTPKVYVMDEPTSPLSREEVGKLFAVIEQLCDKGHAVLYVSHRMGEIFQIAHRVTVMRNGAIVATTPIENLTSAELIWQMTGRTLENVFPERTTPVGDAPSFVVDNLSTVFVRDVTFTLQEGEILGVAGLNSSGRTELLRALIGADQQQGGTMRLGSDLYAPDNPTQAWERGVAYVPEERRSQGVVLSRSVSNNVVMPHLEGFLLDHSGERTLAQQLGQSVKLKAEGVHQTVRQLSGGNQQKVVFARALASQPRVLLLDEPTRGVDVGAKFDIYELIRQASERGTSVVMVSSELPELIGLCDRIAIMREGHLAEIVPAAGLTQDQLLTLCYGEQ